MKIKLYKTIKYQKININSLLYIENINKEIFKSKYFSDTKNNKLFYVTDDLNVIKDSQKDYYIGLINSDKNNIEVIISELINAKDDVDIRAYNRILSNNLKFYKEYKCYKYGFRNLFYDFSKNIMLPPYLLFNHVKYLYYGISKKEARKFKGKGIVITNHISYSDGFVFIRRYYPEAPFTISVYEYYDNVPGFIRFYSRLSNVIRLTGAKAIGILLNALYANKKVAIFPEGKINSDGEMKDLQDGTAYLAIKGHAKIYPSITLNPYKAFHKQYVIFGKAIDPKEFFQNDFSVNKEDVKKLTKIIYQEMINLHNEGMKIINSYE